MLLNIKAFSRIFYAVGLLAAIFLIGMCGYVIIEGFTFQEAIYMTVITVSTVGYGEVRPLSEDGQLFTSILIVTSFGTFAYTISAITTYFVTGEFKDQYKRLKMEERIKKMTDHVIVCGYGRVGNMACEQLKSHNQEFIVIENNDEKWRMLEDKQFPFIEGNATHDDVLREAGLERAKALLTTLPDDAENLFVVLSAREINRSLLVISRASMASSVRKLRIAGADNVIMPDKVGGAHMASLVTSPDVLEFLDHISVQGSKDVNLEEVAFEDLPEDFKNHTLGELDVRKRMGINIIGFKTPDGEYVINPGPDTRITPDSKLFVLGRPSQIKELNASFNRKS